MIVVHLGNIFYTSTILDHLCFQNVFDFYKPFFNDFFLHSLGVLAPMCVNLLS
jgi:hypothetical protein